VRVQVSIIPLQAVVLRRSAATKSSRS
jgi:hypothetical protein